mgnify:CR=1 FL=1
MNYATKTDGPRERAARNTEERIDMSTVQETAPRDNPQPRDVLRFNDLSIRCNNVMTWCRCEACGGPYDAPEFIFVETETHLELCPECACQRFGWDHPVIRLLHGDAFTPKGGAA